MTKRRKETWPRRKTEKPSIGVKIPQACSNCAWKEHNMTNAKVKCNNKDAKVLQENGEWICYSFTTYMSNSKKKRKEKRR